MDNQTILSFLSDEEKTLFERAVEDAKRCNTIGCNVYTLIERRCEEQSLMICSYQIDAYLENIGEKSPEYVIPPLVLADGYRLHEQTLRAHEVLPRWYMRYDGAILYEHRWWGTTSPSGGWKRYAWFCVKSAIVYEQVSSWEPIQKYMHKRKHWQGPVAQGSIGPYRETYSIIVQRGEIDLG